MKLKLRAFFLFFRELVNIQGDDYSPAIDDKVVRNIDINANRKNGYRNCRSNFRIVGSKLPFSTSF